VLTLPLTSELLQAVAGRHSQIGERLSGVEDRELAQSDPLEVFMEFSYPRSLPHPLGVAVSEGLQHRSVVYPSAL